MSYVSFCNLCEYSNTTVQEGSRGEKFGASPSLLCDTESHRGTALQNKRDLIFKEILSWFKKCFFNEVFVFFTL